MCRIPLDIVLSKASEENNNACLAMFNHEQCTYIQTLLEKEKIAIVDKVISNIHNKLELEETRFEKEKLLLVDQIISVKQDVEGLKLALKAAQSKKESYYTNKKVTYSNESHISPPIQHDNGKSSFSKHFDVYKDKWEHDEPYDHHVIENVRISETIFR